MAFLLKSSNSDKYLESSEAIDCTERTIIDCAARLAETAHDEIARTRAVYEFVRDQIRHSFDAQGSIITCNASDVLKHREGICYAKSHLLAALLRRLGIAAGFCYQKLICSDDAAAPRFALHAVNAVYLQSLRRWVRLDARGNKNGIAAQFSLEREILAFPVRPELGEADGGIIYAEPSPNVLAVLRNSRTLQELEANLPSAV